MTAIAIRGACIALHRLLTLYRVIFYNLRAFIWYRPAPWSTVIFGRLSFSHLPCRVSLGRRCRLGDGVFLSTGRDALIRIGDDVSINAGCLVVASEAVTIGRNTAIGEYVSIRDQAHRFAPGHGVRGQGFKVAPIEIGENVWIGRGVFIGPGTRIGSDSIVAANSVVHGEFPAGVLIAGAPARIKRSTGAVAARAAAE